MQAYKVGVFYFIREAYSPNAGGIIPKKYFGGRFDANLSGETTTVSLGSPMEGLDGKELFRITVDLLPSFSEREKRSAERDRSQGNEKGGIDLDPRKGFDLRVSGRDTTSFAFDTEPLEQYAERLAGVTPKISRIQNAISVRPD